MFNIQPGQGLGLSASKEIALGLGTSFVEGVILAVKTFITKSNAYFWQTGMRFFNRR